MRLEGVDRSSRNLVWISYHWRSFQYNFQLHTHCTSSNMTAIRYWGGRNADCLMRSRDVVSENFAAFVEVIFCRVWNNMTALRTFSFSFILTAEVKWISVDSFMKMGLCCRHPTNCMKCWLCYGYKHGDRAKFWGYVRQTQLAESILNNLFHKRWRL
jgi:hypothetical protein